MFPSSRQLLKDVYCPKLREKLPCELPYCVFSHEERKRSRDEPERTVHKRVKTEEPEKRNKTVNESQPESSKKSSLLGSVESSVGSSASSVGSSSRLASPSKADQNTTAAPSAPSTADHASPAPESGIARAIRAAPLAEDPTMLLTPRAVVPFGPATIPQRLSYLKTIHKLLAETKHFNPKTLAMKLEHKTATESTKTSYPTNIRGLAKRIRAGEFKQSLQERARKKQQEEEAAWTRKRDLYRGELEKLIIPEKYLVARGFVLEEPEATTFDAKMSRNCERCQAEFFIHHRTPTICKYHLLRRLYDPVAKKRSDIFPCCSQPLGESNGCCSSERHVFKITDPKLLHALIPYTRAPPLLELEGKRAPLAAAAIDCEMAYTSYGMEMIRLTVIDWDTNKIVLDRTVRPFGEVIDLNTRFSGVHTLEEGIPDPNDPSVVHATVSFKEARELLFEHISASTVIVGHGLENDLHTMRLIHPRVVDTAIRYPDLNPGRTHSLKQLTFTYLGRTIQTGEHDSSEDAIAAMDIIKENIKRALLRKA